MMKKLLVIDQSIRGSGGHHLEYALRVLQAARTEGYEAILASHQAFKGADVDGVRILRTFRYTYWENLHRESTLFRMRVRAVKLRRAARDWLHSQFRRVYYNFVYSEAGLAAQRAQEISGLGDPLVDIFASGLSKSPTGSWSLRAWRVLLLGLAFIRVQIRGFAGLYSRLPRLLRYALHKTYRIVWRILRFFIKLFLVVVGAVVGTAMLPLFFFAGMFGAGLGHRAAFRKDLMKALKAADMSPGDVVFVPTLGETEMLAIADLCERSRTCSKFSWRLLFRRNVYSGRASTYAKENDFLETRRFRLALSEAASKLRQTDVRFFTDTELLTAQYNLPMICSFETVPIPVPVLPPSRVATQSVSRRGLVAGYMGDARDEKGFALLPAMMDYTHREFQLAGHLKLIAQSNFNLPQGEPGSVKAKLALSAFAGDFCELIEGPFDSEEYKHWLSQMDIILAPYDQNSYAARSSGVFAEAIAAGKPTVVTSGTWMASVLEPYRQHYIESILDTLPLGGQRGHHANRPVRDISAAQGAKSFRNLGQLKGMDRFTHLMFQADFQREAPDKFFEVIYSFYSTTGTPVGVVKETVSITDSTVRALTPVPTGAVTVGIETKMLDERFMHPLDRLRVYRFRSHTPVASGFGGRIVDPSAFGLAQGLRDIVENFDEYRNAARRMSSSWADYFSAGSLLRAVLSPDGVRQSPEKSASRLFVGSHEVESAVAEQEADQVVVRFPRGA